MKLIGKLQALNRFNREVLLAVLCALRGLPSEYHFGVVDEITVDGKTVIVLAKVYPIGFDLNGSVSLLQEDDVGHDLGSCVCFESVVRQSDSTKQFCSLSDILTDFGRLLIHRVSARYESNNAARSHLVESLGEEIIVDGETEFVISPVVYLVLTERHVTNGEVIEISSVGGLKASYGDVCLGVKLFCDSSGDAVQFHAVELAVLHRFGQTTEEVADTHSGFKNIAGLKAHVANGFIDRLNDGRACIVSVQRRASCCGIFFGRERSVKLRKLVLPVVLRFIKGICKTAPSDVARQYHLLFGGSLCALKLQFF